MMFKKMSILILFFIIAFCTVSVNGNPTRISKGFMENARPSALTNSAIALEESDLFGTWVPENTMSRITEMSKNEIECINTMHLLKNGKVERKYNNGPVVNEYNVKSGKLVISSYLRSEYTNGEAENSNSYYSIVPDNGVYKLVSEAGDIYVRVSSNEDVDLTKVY